MQPSLTPIPNLEFTFTNYAMVAEIRGGSQKLCLLEAL